MFTCSRGGRGLRGGGGGEGGGEGGWGGKDEQGAKLWQLRRMELRWRQQLHSLTWACDEDDGDGDYCGDEEEGNSDGDGNSCSLARACIDVDDDDDNDDDKKDEDGVAVRQQLVVKMAGGVSQASTNTLSTTAGQLFFLSACRAFNWQQIDK